MLNRLARERELGRTRSLLVAATGTGKTVVAALDYRALCQAQGGQPGGYGGGSPTSQGRGTAGGTGRFSAEDLRQFTREFQEIGRDAQQLRQQLQAAGVNPQDIDAAIRDLRQGENQSAYADPKSLEKLQEAALERLKQFEFNLRRKMESGGDSLALSGSDEVPAGFRQAIEEYYRSLSKGKQ